MKNLTSRLGIVGLFAASAFFAHTAIAVDYPATVDNTVTVTLPAGVTDPNTANNTAGGCAVGDATTEACATDSNTLSVVIPQPTKAFSPSTVDFGNISTLTITLTNSNNFAATLQSDFVDTLPAGLVLATPANSSTTCTGTLTAADGASAITLAAGATIPTSSSCTITADVTSATAGTYDNVSGTLDTGMGASNTANASLIVQPQAELAINNVSQVETDAGTTTFIFTVSITNGVTPTSNITFDYATADGTATIGDSDYVAISTTQGTITAGSTSTTISVTVNGDLTVESDEAFSVNLSNPSANATITTAAGTGTIENDDSSQVSIAATTNGDEAGPIDGQFTVSLTNPSDTDTVIAYSVGGTATSGTDYTALSGTVTILAGSTSATINVPVIDDTIVEGTETVEISLSSVTSGVATIGATNNASIDILDNDASLTIVKRVDNSFGGTAVVGDFSITTDAGALTFSAGVDLGAGVTEYTATTLDLVAGTYTLTENDLFAYNEGAWSCDVGTLNNSAFNNGSISLAAGDATTCTITNAHRQAATLQVAKSWVNANLSDGVNITTSGASNNHNFNSVADSSTETDISTVVNVYEGENITFSENFTSGTASDYSASLSCTGATDTDPSNGLLIDVADAGAIIVCTYENTAGAILQLQKTWVSAQVGDAVTISTSGASNPNSLNSTADSSDETDTSLVTRALVGETIMISESFTSGSAFNYNSILSCTGANDTDPTDGLLIDSSDSNQAIFCTYTNQGILVSIAAGVDGNEAGPVDGTFTVSLSAVSTTDITVDVVYSGAATEGDDYATAVTTVTIPAGSTSATITLDVTDDVLVEGTEGVIATISNPTNGSLGTDNATIDILDNDVQIPTVVSQTTNDTTPEITGTA
ncbi:MAG: hypothetical protein HWD86_01295, partial [Kangiellaceae bacterium]|nr:hypothetical protein [Kangiellaceae bacterium]